MPILSLFEGKPAPLSFRITAGRMVEVLGFTALGVALLAWIQSLRARKDYERRLVELVHQVQEAQAMLARRGSLAREVAHEIKNPLTAILCSAEALDLLIGESLDPQHRKSLRYIREYGNYVLRLISDYLDLSMIESRIKTAEPKRVDLREVADSVKGLLQTFLMRKQVKCAIEAHGPDLHAWVDPRHVRQILYSLLRHAIEAAPAGADLRLILDDQHPGSYLRISMCDNGNGLTERECAQIFDPYHDARGGRSQRSRLEMPLCRMLVELAGGSIRVTSRPGVGTRFDVLIPAAPSEQALKDGGPSADDAARRKPLRGHTVLLVDGDRGAGESAASLIEAWGGIVEIVDEATTALHALAEHRYDVLVMDSSFGPAVSKSGLQCGRVILTSGEPVEEDLLHELNSPAVLRKPFSGTALLRSLLDSEGQRD